MESSMCNNVDDQLSDDEENDEYPYRGRKQYAVVVFKPVKEGQKPAIEVMPLWLVKRSNGTVWCFYTEETRVLNKLCGENAKPEPLSLKQMQAWSGEEFELMREPKLDEIFDGEYHNGGCCYRYLG
jgi:hypothetical protein